MSGELVATAIVCLICFGIPVSWAVSERRELKRRAPERLAANIERLERELGLTNPPTPPRSPGGVG